MRFPESASSILFAEAHQQRERCASAARSKRISSANDAHRQPETTKRNRKSEGATHNFTRPVRPNTSV